MENFYLNYNNPQSKPSTELTDATIMLRDCAKDYDSFLNSSLVNAVKLVKH